MKKTYIKPEMVFDSFKVDTNIADCTNKAESAQNNCGMNFSGLIIFVTNSQGCDFEVDDGFDDICYYVPTADNTVFGS